MATDSNKVQLVLAVKDEASGNIREVEKNFVGSVSRMTQTSSALDDVTTRFGRLLGPMAVGGLVVQAAKMGMEWERTIFQMRMTFQGESEAMMAQAAKMSADMGHAFRTGDIAYAFTKTADSMRRYGIEGQNYLDLVARASDIAAAKGLEVKESIDRIESAMRGEAEASEYLGLTLNDTYMKNMAFGGSLRDTWEKLTDNEKALHRYNEMMIQSSKYQGAAAESAQTLSGVLGSWWNRFADDFSRGMANVNKTLGELIRKAGEAKGLQTTMSAGAMALGSVHGDAGDDLWGIGALVEAQNEATERSTFQIAEWQRQVDSSLNTIRALEIERANLLSGYAATRENHERKLAQALSEQARLERQLRDLTLERAQAGSHAAAQAADAAIADVQARLQQARSTAFIEQQERLRRIQDELEEKAAKGQLSTAEAQRQITGLLKDRQQTEELIADLVERRAQLERQLAATDEAAGMHALRDAIFEIDNALVPMNDLLRQTENVLNEVERTRVATIDANIDKAQDQVHKLLDQLDDVGAASRDIQLEIRTDGAMAHLQEVYAMLVRIAQMRQMNYQINILGAMSPARPFSETYTNLLNKLGSIPGGQEYQIEFLMKKGMDASSAREVTRQYASLSQIRQQLWEAQGFLEQYRRNTTVGYAQPSTGAMAGYYENIVIPKIQSKIAEQQSALMAAVASGVGRVRETPASGGWSSGGGVSLNINTIHVNAPEAGSARDFAVGTAVALDLELAALVKSNRSQLRQALGV